MGTALDVPGESVPITSEEDIVLARQRARDVARTLKFSAIDQSRIATAVSELARNVMNYGGGRGEAVVRETTSDRGVGIEIHVSDSGPGIPDVEMAMQRGYSSGHGMGLGLPGTKRLMDEMEIKSNAASGTHITIRKWRR
jgi:serine/threonine-protein kinase RsbT